MAWRWRKAAVRYSNKFAFLPCPCLMDAIRIRGARTHNLKNINLDLPRQQLTVITGLSGSGKSSLAFDTLYAEGQRRYVQSLSAYARQFLQRLEKPDVDLIEGLSPAIAIEQKSTSHNPRSTVGTVTEIHDYLRLLYARVGTPHCPEHGLPLQAYSVSQMVDAVQRLAQGTRVAILAPLQLNADPADQTPASFAELRARLQAQGFVRLRAGREIVDINTLLPNASIHPPDAPLAVVIDRLRVRPDISQRLAESFETALAVSAGKVLAWNMDDDYEQAFSLHYACPVCDYRLEKLEPRLFSFNNPAGACPTCNGLGTQEYFDPRKVVAFPDLGLGNGAIQGWDKRNTFSHAVLTSLAAHYGFDLNTPFSELPPALQHTLLHGSGEQAITFIYPNQRDQSIQQHPFEGILPNLDRRWRESRSPAVHEALGKLRSTRHCPDCNGTRLRMQARHVLLGADADRKNGLAIFEVLALSLKECQAWFEALPLTGMKKDVASRIVQEICTRLAFLNNVGLGYLSLERSASTLSGGEAQRIHLASQIGSSLSGVMYVLDEPSIGLHQRDNDRLIHTLRHLRDLGNSVIVVEHDEDMIRSADYVVDMGPGAGEQGGEVVAQGTPAELAENPDSLTGQYLGGALAIAVPKRRAIKPDGDWLYLRGCTGNNLKSADLSLPVGRLVCVTGVSGSGKSTLVNDTLVNVLSRALTRSQIEPAPYHSIDGLAHFDKIISVDQSPIGRTPRSNPATYTGLFTPIRELFAEVPEARARGYDPGRFSFNVRGGRCEACQGDGVVKVEMHFLPDMYVPCEACGGRRYSFETLQVQYRGLNISQVLELTVDQALHTFGAVPAIARKLQTLVDVGLGYLRLGQSATTLSGGEAQRVKLSQELSRRSTGRTLYVLDEPTTGLHFHDIALLLDVLQRLVDQGNTVLVIEHNLDVIKTADWVVDMGPEGGINGGHVIAQGTPEQIAAQAEQTGSHTGRYLKASLTSA